jgi:predicted AAA+ superfamily ATPase
MINRILAQEITAALNDTPVVFLAGARQTGKSTLVNHLAENGYAAQYITFDDYAYLSAAKTDPQGFVSGLPSKVIIDEVQRAPEIFLPIKAVVDARKSPGQFLLTGSANILLIPKISDSLAGRIEIGTLWPFAQCELKSGNKDVVDNFFDHEWSLSVPSLVDDAELWDIIVSGGYPEAVFRADWNRKTAWFRNYITTLLQRDIREIAHIDGLSVMPNLLHLLAARTANLLNFADLSRSVQIPQTSLKRYFALLESIFIVNKIMPWSSNFNSRLTKAPKIYLNDTGLLSYFLGVNATRLSENRTLAGQFLETFVVNEILKLSSWSRTRPDVFYFRTTSGREIDIILEDARGRCVAIEVKGTNNVNSRDAEDIKFFRDAMGDKFVRGLILYTGKGIIPFQKDIHAIPVSVLWA